MADFEQARQAGVEVGQAQDFGHAFLHPLVVGDGVDAARDKEGLEKFIEGMVEALEGLEVQPARRVAGDVGQVVAAVLQHHRQPLAAQVFIVIRQPARAQRLIVPAARALPERDGVGQGVAHLQLKGVRAAGPAVVVAGGVKITVDQLEIDVREGGQGQQLLVDRVSRVVLLPERFQARALGFQHFGPRQNQHVHAGAGHGLAARAGAHQQHSFHGRVTGVERGHRLGGGGMLEGWK